MNTTDKVLSFLVACAILLGAVMLSKAYLKPPVVVVEKRYVYDQNW